MRLKDWNDHMPSSKWRPRVWRRRASTLVFSLIAGFVLPGHAPAKNLNLLIRYLTPAFLAQNFAALCKVNDPLFLSNLPPGTESIDKFSERMKEEITRNLPPEVAARIVLISANTALRAARSEMRKVDPKFPKMAPQVLKRWCYDDGRPFILRVIKKNESEHKAFLKIIKAAKQ